MAAHKASHPPRCVAVASIRAENTLSLRPATRYEHALYLASIRPIRQGRAGQGDPTGIHDCDHPQIWRLLSRARKEEWFAQSRQSSVETASPLPARISSSLLLYSLSANKS